jgi:hypothetical protein
MRLEVMSDVDQLAERIDREGILGHPRGVSTALPIGPRFLGWPWDTAEMVNPPRFDARRGMGIMAPTRSHP